MRIIKREYMKNKRKTNINFKIKENLRNRIYCVLNRNAKSEHTLDLLGCSVEELRTNLEKQFTKGMNWSNYGRKGWVVDHIKPCASFDLSKASEQRKCFHYTNLQPLWAKDNLEKGIKNA